MFGYIYKTIDINDKVYIGQHHGEFDINYFGSGKIISKIIKKRKDLLRVELLEVCNNQNELNEKEIYWINEYNSLDNKFGYNLQKGGQGYNYEKPSTFFGKKHTEEAIEKNRKAHIGKKLSDETKKKISNKLKGRPNPNKGKHFSEDSNTKKSISLLGKKKSDEHRQHIKEANIGKKLSVETKDKIKNTLKSRNFIGKVKWVCNKKINISKKLPIEEANKIVENNKDWQYGRIRTWKNQYE